MVIISPPPLPTMMTSSTWVSLHLFQQMATISVCTVAYSGYGNEGQGTRRVYNIQRKKTSNILCFQNVAVLTGECPYTDTKVGGYGQACYVIQPVAGSEGQFLMIFIAHCLVLYFCIAFKSFILPVHLNIPSVHFLYLFFLILRM